MMFLANMRIGRRIGLGLAVLCFLLVVNVGFAWNAISTVGAQLNKFDRTASGQKPADIAGTVHAAKRGVFLVALATLALAAGFGYLLARSIALPIGEALRVAEAVAIGDLSGDIQPRGTAETAQLMRALQAIQAELAAIVAEVRDGTGAIASASERISRGNADLSRRSDQHASSLEQTASSMEQLAATVKQNADNAHQAHLLVENAHGRAAGAAEAVSRMVGAMDDVASSSREIAKIVGVIDDRAFQTNLLALNAAVEAARAGEKGRGFAVVAAEVRSLAGRSAQAAKEIKGLVQTSLRAAQEGENAVEQCGEALAELHGEIKNVKTIAGEIAVASREQSSGIEQVNNAVMNMDEMIQRNAALEASSAADAEALDERTRALARAVAKFTLDVAAVEQSGGEESHVLVVRRTAS